MTDAEFRLLLKYATTMLIAFVLAGGSVLVTQLAGDGDIQWRAVLAAGIGAALPIIATTQLARTGSTEIAQQVDSLRAEGYHRSEMVVVPADTIPNPLPPLTPEMRRQIVADIKAEMARDPSGALPVPPPVPDFDWNKDR